MDKTTKHIIIIISILVGLGVVGSSVYWFIYLPHKEKNEEEEKKQRLEAQNAYLESQQGNDEGAYKFNVEGELDYPATDLLGKYLYPKPALIGGEGYAWVRSSAEVDNGGWDFWSNQITKVHDMKKIGKVVDFIKGNEKGYAYTWFKVSLDKGLGVSETYGWVRSDAVIYKNI